MSKPKISAVLPTYGRIVASTCVEEAVASFVMQDYQNKELIIVNDCPQHEITCAYPDVTVLNVGARFPTLGDKLNFGFKHATGEIYCRFDDDDISLPWRLSQGYAAISKGLHVWQQSHFWFFGNTRRLETRKEYPTPSKALFTKEVFDFVSGFSSMNTGQDVDFEQKLTRAGIKVVREDVKPENVNYIYRWQTDILHLSSLGEGGYERLQQDYTAERFWLQPHWQEDYVRVTRTLAEDCNGKKKDTTPPPAMPR